MKDNKKSYKEMIAVNRGTLTENIHFGAYCLTGESGEILYSFGNSSNLVFSRSTAKPFQALLVVLSGAFEKFKLTEKELAIICSSHFAEDQHIEQVSSILKKIGLSEKDLLTPLTYSRSQEVKEMQLLKGYKPSKIYSDCSGKHAGMLSVCKMMNYPIEDYVNPDHPLQQEIAKVIKIIYSYEKIEIGIDGCSAPVFAVPLETMAQSYLTLITAKLNNKQKEMAKKFNYSVEKIESALKIVKNSMLANPQMVAGTNGLCSLLISLYGGNCIAKVGAAGIYCLGINDFITKHSIGISLKISDGSIQAAEFALMSILYRLNILPSTRSSYLDEIIYKKNLNEHKNPIGKYIFLDENLPTLLKLI